MPYETCGKVTVLCAWCGNTMQDGDRSGPPSHGICEPCTKSYFPSEWAKIRDLSEKPTGGGDSLPQAPSPSTP